MRGNGLLHAPSLSFSLTIFDMDDAIHSICLWSQLFRYDSSICSPRDVPSDSLRFSSWMALADGIREERVSRNASKRLDHSNGLEKQSSRWQREPMATRSDDNSLRIPRVALIAVEQIDIPT